MNARLAEEGRTRRTSLVGTHPFEGLCFEDTERRQYSGSRVTVSTFSDVAHISKRGNIVFYPFSAENLSRTTEIEIDRHLILGKASAVTNLTCVGSSVLDRQETATIGILTLVGEILRNKVISSNLTARTWIASEDDPGGAAPSPDPANLRGEGALARFQSILEKWRGNLLTVTLNRVKRQLSYLLGDQEDLAELSGGPDRKSFEALLAYLAARPWTRAPSLTLTHEGIFVGNWRPAIEQKARLSVDFIDDKHVQWSAVDARDGESPTMTGGICPISRLDDQLAGYRGWLLL